MPTGRLPKGTQFPVTNGSKTRKDFRESISDGSGRNLNSSLQESGIMPPVSKITRPASLSDRGLRFHQSEVPPMYPAQIVAFSTRLFRIRISANSCVRIP